MLSKCARSLLAAAIAILISVLAAPQPPSCAEGSYTVTLRYYDSVQITYTLAYPSGTIWSGAGDIPIGGTSLSSQVYCIDPFVRFHSVAETTSDKAANATVDTMRGYTIAAPWTVSGAIQLHNDAIRWLIINGYRGDYLADDPVSRASVTRLNGLYPTIGSIDKKIALMATKVAVWKTLIGDNVVIKRTSLNQSETKIFEELVTRLVNDAKIGRPTDAGPPTEFWLDIDADNPDIASAGGYIYYGPLFIDAGLDNAIGAAGDNLDNVFLSVSGIDSEGLRFVFDDGGGAAELPDDMPLYGTGAAAQYLSNADFVFSGGGWRSRGFYLRIPETREPRPGAQPQDLLTVKAMGLAPDVRITADTPVMYVYSMNGTHDWDYVQAYGGAGKENAFADLYAEARLDTCVTPLGKIYVSKNIEDATQLDNDKDFIFQLLYGYSPDELSVVNLSLYNVSSVYAADYGDNTFTLRNGGVAVIDGLPSDRYYQVRELGIEPAEFLAPRIDIASAGDISLAQAGDYVSGAFRMGGSGGKFKAAAGFTNIKNTARDIAHLYIGKVAVEYLDGGSKIHYIQDEDFVFLLECLDADGETWNPVDLAGIFQSEAGSVADGGAGIFRLKSFERAYIELEAFKEYRITEMNGEQKYRVLYALERFEYAGDDDWEVFSSSQADVPDWGGHGGNYITESLNAGANSYFYIVYANINASVSNLSIRKEVAGGGADEDSDNMFKFQVVVLDDLFDEPPPYAIPVSAAQSGSAMLIRGIGADRIEADENGAPTIFSLKHGETAVIENLPDATYIIRELSVSDGYTASYFFGADEEGAKTANESGETGEFHLSGDTLVTIVNTPAGGDTPDDPDDPDPDDPDKPDPDDPDPDDPDKPNPEDPGPDDPDKPGPDDPDPKTPGPDDPDPNDPDKPGPDDPDPDDPDKPDPDDPGPDDPDKPGPDDPDPKTPGPDDPDPDDPDKPGPDDPGPDIPDKPRDPGTWRPRVPGTIVPNIPATPKPADPGPKKPEPPEPEPPDKDRPDVPEPEAPDADIVGKVPNLGVINTDDITDSGNPTDAPGVIVPGDPAIKPREPVIQPLTATVTRRAAVRAPKTDDSHSGQAANILLLITGAVLAVSSAAYYIRKRNAY